MTTFKMPREQERKIYLKEIERLNKINVQLLGFLEVIIENHGFCVFEEDCPDCRPVRKAQLFIEELKRR